MKTFEQYFSENLSGFGWKFPPTAIPDEGAVGGQLMFLRDWSTGLDEFTRDVLRTVELADSILHAYGFANWAGQFELHSGHRIEEFTSTLDILFDCWERARNAALEQSESVAAV